ncbi:hypothetical protein H6503_06920 [Candidatus Woesearchaeota archaeon]|nr:hypothetical protein [Candidatus Woesearchaeota archaeon]
MIGNNLDQEVKVQAPPKEDGLTDLLAGTKERKTKDDKYDLYLKELEYRR